MIRRKNDKQKQLPLCCAFRSISIHWRAEPATMAITEPQDLNEIKIVHIQA